jgi:uncharacterized protein YjbI with pentapeptide repeats
MRTRTRQRNGRLTPTSAARADGQDRGDGLRTPPLPRMVAPSLRPAAHVRAFGEAAQRGPGGAEMTLAITTAVVRVAQVFGLIAALCLAAVPDAGARDASHTSSRPWIHEEEFRSDRTLRATPDKVVILHLVSTPSGSDPIVHRIPYRFDDTAPFTFCIPADDPHLRRMSLVSVPGGALIVDVARGGDCVHKTIAAGRYDLLVAHDGSGIDARGKKAFLHVPRRYSSRRPALTAGDTVATDNFWGIALTQCPTAPIPGQLPYAILQVADSGYVVAGPATGASESEAEPSWLTLNVQSAPTVTTKSLPPDWRSVPQMYWTFCPSPTSGAYYIIGAPGAYPSSPTQSTLGESCVVAAPSGILYLAPSSVLYTVSTGSCSAFALKDLGNFQLTMSVVSPTTLNGALVELDGSSRLIVSTTSTNPVTLNLVATFSWSDPGSDPPTPQAGQVMIGGDPQFGISFVALNQSLPNLTWSNPILPFSIVVPFSVGPQTVATFFSDFNYQGSPQVVATTSQVPDSVGLPFSLTIATARDFVAATLACTACNLSGADLSSLDLTGGSFTSSTFIGANLTLTKFTNATLNGADFSSVANTAVTSLQQTDFTGAMLNCAAGAPGSFASTDVSTATFGAVETSQLTTDFSCRLDFTGATLNADTIPANVWPYLNLTGATINNAAGTILSTQQNPLTLSGAILDGVILGAVGLDFAVLGCTTFVASDGNQICTSLQGTDLKSASLQNVDFRNAKLNGATLSNANLTGSNLCGAQLTSQSPGGRAAVFNGAQMKNVSLYQATATGAQFANANFYSSGGTPGTCTQQCQVPSTCATAQIATLNQTNFSGAYLQGTDMSSTKNLESVNFAGAVLVDVRLSGATIAPDPTIGNPPSFKGALLQGANFGGITVTSTDFTNAVVTTPTAGEVITVLLSDQNTQFAGYKASAGSTPGCVQFFSSNPLALPTTDNTDTCPDGNPGANPGGCSPAQWMSPGIPGALPWTSGFTALPTGCNAVDKSW